MTWSKNHQQWNSWGRNGGDNNGGNRQQRRSAGRSPQDGKGKSSAAGQAVLPSYDKLGTGSGLPSSASSQSVDLPEKVMELILEVSQKDGKIAEQLGALLPDSKTMKEDSEMKQQQQLLNRVRKVKVKIQKKEAALNTKEAQLRSFLEQVRVHVKNEKDRHAQETTELKQELEELKLELEQLREGKLPTKEADEQSLEAMLISDSETDHGAKEKQLQEELSLAKQQAASANEMAYAMKAQLDSLMSQFQAMRHLQPNGLTPPGSEELQATGGTDMAAAGGAIPLKDPKAPFGLRHQQRERHGPYTASPAKPVEKPVEQEEQLLPAMD